MSETVNAAHGDNQTRHFTDIGVIGTLGTADVKGSANTLPFSVNPDNGAVYSAIVNPIDDVSGAVTTIDFAHHEVHDGDHFFVDGFGTVGVGTSIDFTIVTPNTTRWSHMLFNIETTQPTEIYIYEANNLGTGGTAATPINNNRNSLGTSTLVIKQGQTVGTLGTLLSSKAVGAPGVAGKSSGGMASRVDEMILKQNSNYLYRITSRGGTNIISYQGYWYEHTSIT